MLGLKRRLFPTVLIAMRKNLLPLSECFRAVELCVKCLTKRDKVRVDELMLINVEDRSYFFSQKLWISVFQRTHLGSLFEKKIKKSGAKRGDDRGDAPPFFCIYLFIDIYYGSSAETLS